MQKRLRNCWKIAEPPYQDAAREALRTAGENAARLKRAAFKVRVQIGTNRKGDAVIAEMDGAPNCPVLEFDDMFWEVAERSSQLPFVPFQPEVERWDMVLLVQAFQSELRRANESK